MLLVFVIVCHDAPLLLDDSQCKILPMYPVRKSVPLFNEVQTTASEETKPATVSWLTVTETVLEYCAAQFPL